MKRGELLASVEGRDFDVVVVGGGITGAGVFRLACAHGLRALLLEQRDFAWGTSSRSAKLVHGGLRYVAQGQLRNSFHSVRQREQLLRAYPGLVQPLEFCAVPPGGSRVMKWGMGGALALYDRMAGRRSRRWHDREAFRKLLPGFARVPLGGFTFVDGTTDDARLVMRVLAEGVALGGVAINYAPVKDLVRTPGGRVSGVVAEDAPTGRSFEVRPRAVISATGAWADELRGRLGHRPRLRKLRGSHLVFPRERLPLERAVGLQSPADKRNMYAMPWAGRILLGTTDLDHREPLSEEPRITRAEADYLLETVNHWFPDAKLGRQDVISTVAGVRPVVDTGKADPSKESREEVVWADDGLVTISGGKLTTFVLMARKALDKAGRWLGGSGLADRDPLAKRPVPAPPGGDAWLGGRYGPHAEAVAALADDQASGCIAGTDYRWAELRWAAEREQVVHLDDLLLRRVRVGLLLPDGGLDLLDRVRALTAKEIGWDDAKWQQEIERYEELWRSAYGPDLASG